MKTTVLIFAGLFLVAISTAMDLNFSGPDNISADRSPSFLWTETIFDFGNVTKNHSVAHKFSFTNNGEDQLVIASVKASCGCTVTDYSRDPIAPGEEGFVRVTYNATSIGSFTKTVTVVANTVESSTVLTIKGDVIP